MHRFNAIMIFCLLIINNCNVIGAEKEVAQDRPAHVVETLVENMKIIESELVLKDFKEGKKTTRVIVTLSKPVRFEQDRDFKDPAFRNELQVAVWAAQEKVISRLGSGKVRIISRFVYIFGFSAEVNLAGLKELTQIEDVLSISKDRVLKMHNRE